MIQENNKINIAIICTSLHGIGGTNYHVASWLNSLDKSKFDVYFICYTKIMEDFRKNFEKMLDAHLLDRVILIKKNSLMDFTGLTVLKLALFLKKLKISVVHTIFLQSDIIGAMASKIAGIPVLISSVEGKLIPPVCFLKRLIYAAGNKIVRSWFDMTIVISHGLFLYLKENNQINTMKTKVIHSGIDTSDNISQISEIESKEISTVGVISRLSKEKGINYFLDAVPDILKENPHVSIIIAGGGEEESRLKNQSNFLNLQDKVKFLGWVDNTKSVLARLDILVIPSLEEGLPRILLEALYYKRAVIATDVGGIPEVIEHEKSGILVPSQNSKAIAKAVKALLKDANKLQYYGNNGHEKIKRDFSLSKEIREIEELYINLSKEKGIS
ncbi:MAG: glycosyltransferase family 4 protein [bacterium]